MTFVEAVTQLLGDVNVAYKSYEKQAKPIKELIVPPKNNQNKKVFAYLTKHRGIDPSVLCFFIKENLIYESKERSKDQKKVYNNAIFVGRDRDNKIAHIQKRSVFSFGKRFVQCIEGSNPKCSFNFMGGSDRLYVFESPIDMLSFISMQKDENWQQHNYVALCGVSSYAMLYQLENPIIDQVVFCLDNDTAGQKATQRLVKFVEEKGLSHSVIVPENKDFNEDLVQAKTEVLQPKQLEMVMR